ncbi:MAG: glycosyltransferase involved in cell wall biosynthesis [Halioglobus sp.]|jgi:glycosyltransferase involved in cell wall biosynthesis
MVTQAGSLVSVVVPVYNGEQYLAEALDSVLSQTERNLEILVVDDGSNDSSAAIIAEYTDRDERVRMLTQPNSGVTAARNAGILASRSQYIAFIDQDDRWRHDALATHLHTLYSKPDLGYTLAHQVCFLQPGATAPDWFQLQKLDEAVAGYLPGALCTRRSVFDTIGLFDERYSVSSDADWFAKARDANVTMELLSQVILERRIHSVNQSRHAEFIQKELLQLLHESIRRKREQL